MGVALLDSLLGDGSIPDDPASDWFVDVRRRASEALVRDGLPTAREEAWKYTNLRSLAQRRHARGDEQAASRAIDAATIALPGADGPRVVFVNGVYRADLSRWSAIEGVSFQSFSEVIAGDAQAERVLLTRRFDSKAQAFARLNSALVLDGPVIRVAAGVGVPELVHVVYVGAATGTDIAWQARALVELGEGASLRLVEHHVGEAGQADLGNTVSQFALRAHARLDLLQLQTMPESGTLIRRSEAVLEADAQLHVRTLELGGLLVRHDLAVELAGDRARLHSRGVFALRGRQHVDTHLDVRHVARDTVSDLLWRGVADQRSRGVFHGAITVAAGADGADANLSNKNLLLSAQAEIDTQPVLEIHADEVKAAHGATVGQLDEHALFYLRARGLPMPVARALLMLAFCRVAVDSIENVALHEHIDALLLERLPHAAMDTDEAQSGS